jgi:hypothetical protein
MAAITNANEPGSGTAMGASAIWTYRNVARLVEPSVPT